MRLMNRRTWLIGAVAWGAFASLRAETRPPNATHAIVAVMKSQFDRPDAPLQVQPVAVVSGWALAGWQQGERAGRALLRHTPEGWQIQLCGGAGLLDVTTLQQAGLPRPTAKVLSQRARRLEKSMPAAMRARMDAFEGLISVRAGMHSHSGEAHAPHGTHPPHGK